MKVVSGQVPNFDGQHLAGRTGGDLVVMQDDVANPIDGHHMVVADDGRIVARWRAVLDDRQDITGLGRVTAGIASRQQLYRLALINQPLHPAISADTGFPVRQHRIPSTNACIPLLGRLGGNDDPPSDHAFLPSSSITTEFDWQQTTRQA